MKYFATIGGMVNAMLAEAGEKDDSGNPITETEKPMTEEEYAEFRKSEIKKQFEMFQ